jgi:hypothetical protein
MSRPRRVERGRHVIKPLTWVEMQKGRIHLKEIQKNPANRENIQFSGTKTAWKGPCCLNGSQG